MTKRSLVDLLTSKRFHAGLFAFGFVVALVLYVIAAHASRYNLSNIDGISYMSIAKQYAAGQLDWALNAYWSPFVSWLMVPFIWVGMDALAAFMYVNVISAVIGLVLIVGFTWRFTKGHFWATAISFVVAFSLYISQIPTITPDSFVMTWMIGFTWMLVELDRLILTASTKKLVWVGIALGAVGVLGYLIKQFLIPVFFVTLLAWVLLRLWLQRKSADERQQTRRHLIVPAVAVLSAIVIAAPWVAALSVKYGEFTIGSSFSVNIGMKFEPATGTEVRDPLELVTPPNPGAVAYGEDRGIAEASTAFESTSSLGERLTYYVKERIIALPFYLDRISGVAPFAFLIVVAFALAWCLGRVDTTRFRVAGQVALVWIIYFLGYAAITQASSGGGNIRYYWPLLPLSTMLAVLLIAELWRGFSENLGRAQKLLALGVVALLPVSAFTQNVLGEPFPFSNQFGAGSVAFMFGEPVKPIPHDLAEEMKRDGVIEPDSNIVGSNYRMTLRLGYYLEGHVFGRSGHYFDISDPAFRQVLSANDIDYFLRYTPAALTPPDVSEFATLRGVYTSTITCADDRVAEMQDCRIEVLELK